MIDVFTPFLPLAIGSFPHRDPNEALDLIFRYIPSAPLWPQLPQKDYYENMYVQYSGGMPSIQVDQQRERIFFDTSSKPEADLEEFYAHVLADDLDYFAFPAGCSSGFTAFLESMKQQRGGNVVCVKGQVTGPFSFGLTVTDENDRAVIYNSQYAEAMVTAISLNARWQAEQLKKIHPTVIMFIDEPYLVSFGSAFVSFPREEVVRSINAVIDQIHKAGALAGVHCCGNTDWSLVLETNLDLLNFDAYQYFDNVILYDAHLKKFLQGGGMIAWGIVPSDDRILSISVDELESTLRSQMETLASKSIEAESIKRRSLLSPACGLGSQTVEVAEEALMKLEALFRRLSGIS
jgi:methionine synthase II (cobalamin-independent)